MITTKQTPIFDQLPKVSWELREDGVMDYKTPDGLWGFRSSALGEVDWENEDRRNVFIAYDALMRCDSFFMESHDIGGRSSDLDIQNFQKTTMLSGRASYVVLHGTHDECTSLLSDLRIFADSHPKYFEGYLDGIKRMQDPEGFVIQTVYTGESKK